MVPEILSRQIFTDISNLHCDLDLVHSISIFHMTLQFTMLYHQSKLVCKQIKCIEDTAETVKL